MDIDRLSNFNRYKKSSGPCFNTVSEKYQFISEKQKELSMGRLCHALQVSRSGYYAWCGRPMSQRSPEYKSLLQKIKQLHESKKAVYGSPRICQELKNQGFYCSPTRVARLMKKHGIIAKTKKLIK